MGKLSKLRKQNERGGGGEQGPQLCGHISLATLARMRKELGEGPMRFAPKFKERSIAEQIKALQPEQRLTLENVKLKWETKYPAEPFTEDMYLRFCRCSPGADGPFHERNALKVMKKYERRYQHLAARDLVEQLLSKAIFPIPKMTTIEGHEVLYMRPGIQSNNANLNMNNKTDSSDQAITDNLVYAVNTMMECEDPCTDGIACLANMCDWTATGFATDTCFQFMSLLQNKIPVRVNVFLIVNPPKSFGRIWNLTKPLLEKSFRDKVKIVQNTNDLSKYLAKGFLDFLPDDFEGVGLTSTNTMVKDYVTYRIAVENELGHCRDVSSSSSAASSMAVCSSTSLARLPMRKGRVPWAASNTNLASDRSVCTTTTHLQRRAQRRSSDYGIIPTSSGSSVCGPTPSGNSSAAAPVRPSRAQRRGSGSHNFPTTGEQKRRSSGSHFPITTIGDQKQQQDPHGGDSSSELPSSIRPPRMLRRGSGSHGSTDPNQIPHQHLAQQQSSTKKAPKFEKRLSGLVRSNSITSLSSNKYVTFEDDRNNNKVAAPNKKPGERLGRRLSGLGSMTLPSVSSSSSSTPSTSNGKAAGCGEKMMVASGGAPKPVIKRQLSGSTLATDAEESTLTNISH